MPRLLRIPVLSVALVLFSPAAWAQNPPVFKFNWGSFGTDAGQFVGTTGIAIGPSGDVYAVELAGTPPRRTEDLRPGTQRVQKFDSTGSFILEWRSGDDPQVGEFWPSGIAVDAATGDVYVTDHFFDPVNLFRILKFDSNGVFILEWGSTGFGDGQFRQPHGIAVDPLRRTVYVVCRDSDRIQKFDTDGNFITKWGSFGTGDGQFDKPIDASVDPSGNVYVVEFKGHRVQKFDSDGNFITKWGSFGTAVGQFRNPHDVFVEATTGDVYVTDGTNNRVQVFDSNGLLLTTFGSAGTADGLFGVPHGIALDASGNIYVADQGNHRIQVFEPLDSDADGLSDVIEVEIAMGTDCPDRFNDDSDGDTLTDKTEVDLGTDPCNPDSDNDGVPDNIDPFPRDPGVPPEFLEGLARDLCDAIQALDPSVFNGPNNNANKGRRNSLANRACNSANRIASNHFAAAIALLESLLDKVDGLAQPPDWIDDSVADTTDFDGDGNTVEPLKVALADEVSLLSALLLF